jgi:Raf kinase inhibitor-like YbhB/YbcL family protein
MSPGIERAIGRLFRPVRAGDRHLAWNDPRVGDTQESIRLTSPAFADGTAIPSRYAGTGVGDNLSPPLEWSGIPTGAVELVLVLQDPDAPLLRPVVHLIAVGIAPDSRGVSEGGLSPGRSHSVILGRGSFNRIGYAGPRPVRGHGAHRYVFQMFALAHRLMVPKEPDLATVMTAMAGRVIARGRLVGIYERT